MKLNMCYIYRETIEYKTPEFLTYHAWLFPKPGASYLSGRLASFLRGRDFSAGSLAVL